MFVAGGLAIAIKLMSVAQPEDAVHEEPRQNNRDQTEQEMNSETSLTFGFSRAKQERDGQHRRRGCDHDQREYQLGSNILSFRDCANLLAGSEGNGDPYEDQRNKCIRIVGCQRNSPEGVLSEKAGYDRR